MANDELLREALREDAAGDAAPAPWTDVRARGRQIRRRRSMGRAGVAVVTIAALTVGVVALTGGFEQDASIVATGDPTAMPGASTEVVAVVGDNDAGDRLVVLDASDGHEVRTLAEGIGITNAGVAVTPDGRTAYFARVRHGLPCGTTEIAHVPVDGSAEPEVIVSPGSRPQVSPDGSTLAYSRPSGDDCAADGISVVLRDLVSGAERTLADIGAPAELQSFSPGGGRVLVGIRSSDGKRFDRVVEFALSDGATTFTDVATPADDVAYLRDGRLVASVRDDETGILRVVPYVDRMPTDPLFSVDERGALWLEDDASGQLLLHFGGDLLQRWREGNAAPTTIARGVRDAAWVPKPVAASVERG